METKLLTARMISQALNTTPSEINKALLEAKLMVKGEGGYLSNSYLGQTFKSEKRNASYVKWDEKILEHKIFSSKKENSDEKDESLTSTAIAKYFELKAQQINNILLELHFVEKFDNGYILKAEHLGHQKMFKNRPFVVWNKEILENPILNREINEIKSKKAAFEEEANGNKEASSEAAFKFDRKEFDAEYRSQSGHFVRSRAEVVVADWLYSNYFSFAYEKRLPIIEEVYSDFFLNKEKIYIEVWGLESSKKYKKRKERKIELYQENGYRLIGLTDEDIKNIDDFLPLKLAQMGIKMN